jgi:hypothetical protein
VRNASNNLTFDSVVPPVDISTPRIWSISSTKKSHFKMVSIVSIEIHFCLRKKHTSLDSYLWNKCKKWMNTSSAITLFARVAYNIFLFDAVRIWEFSPMWTDFDKCPNLSKRNVKLILKVSSDLEPLKGSSNKKTLYSTRSCVNWAFFGLF